MRTLLLSFGLAAFPAASSALTAPDAEMMLCAGTGDSTLLVELWKPSDFDQPVHCLQAAFIADITACAPQGGWGLSSDRRDADLVDVTNDWKTAHKHQAGKVTAVAGQRGVRFIAHRGIGIASNLSYEWKFSVDRRTGEAIWFDADGQKTRFTCEVLD